MNRTARRLAMLAGIATATALASASAMAYPANVVGPWAMTANQTQLMLTITQQIDNGACSQISGMIAPAGTPNPNQPIQGYYCPSTGAIGFLRKVKGNNDTYQVYTGTLSSAPAAGRLMSGTFTSYDPISAGEYPFGASQ